MKSLGLISLMITQRVSTKIWKSTDEEFLPERSGRAQMREFLPQRCRRAQMREFLPERENHRTDCEILIGLSK